MQRSFQRSIECFRKTISTRNRSFKRCNSTLNESLILHPLLEQKAQQIKSEYVRLSQDIANDAVYDVEKGTKFNRMSVLVENIKKYDEVKQEMTDLEEMMSDSTLKADAEKELEKTRKRLEEVTNSLQGKLVPSNPFIDRACMLEIRPGVGGQEAMLFANDLLEMYQNYALKNRWNAKLISISRTPSFMGANGIVHAILSISDPGSYEKLQYEGGVHRVQRVPHTETKGRVHTSTAAVIVLPQMSRSTTEESDEDEQAFAPGEVKVETMRSRGAGGQHVNKTESAVRLTHIPTGIQVAMQDDRSQHKNKAKAFLILRARLAEKERIEHEEEERQKRTSQVTTTNRSDKIRTYNFSQNRITDHRCGYSAYNLPETMTGEGLDSAIEAMDEYTREMRLKELVEN